MNDNKKPEIHFTLPMIGLRGKCCLIIEGTRIESIGPIDHPFNAGSPGNYAAVFTLSKPDRNPVPEDEMRSWQGIEGSSYILLKPDTPGVSLTVRTAEGTYSLFAILDQKKGHFTD
jgi:hypothetical protein